MQESAAVAANVEPQSPSDLPVALVDQLAALSALKSGWCDEDENSVPVAPLVPSVTLLLQELHAAKLLSDNAFGFSFRMFADAPGDITLDWRAVRDTSAVAYVACYVFTYQDATAIDIKVLLAPHIPIVNQRAWTPAPPMPLLVRKDAQTVVAELSRIFASCRWTPMPPEKASLTTHSDLK